MTHPPFPIPHAPKGFFITGTDTGVGKTLFSAALLHAEHLVIAHPPPAPGEPGGDLWRQRRAHALPRHLSDLLGIHMHNTAKWLMSLSVCALLMACGGDKTTGKACLGSNNDTLVEGMQDKCKAGDIVATKHPAYFCDFNYAVTFNSYNSAICVYSGGLKPERTTEKS